MDNVSVNKANSLYWLGRYVERAYSISTLVTQFYDRMVDSDERAYEEFCSRLGIERVFKDKNEFVRSIITNAECSSSIAFALEKAYNNSIILREQINTEAVAYIQLAYNNIKRTFTENCHIMDLQNVLDNLMSFWGAVDDFIIEDNVRDAIKAGKYIERIDIYIRFEKDMYTLDGCKRRLARYIGHLDTNNQCEALGSYLKENEIPDFEKVEGCINTLFR